ncbi:MAG: hypothetical protein ACYDCQ_20520 [Dehalococcoidia bacterium]
MWTVAYYRASSLFSLKPSMATSSGGRTLLVPTPFSVKMALLDAAIRTLGLEAGRALFEPIRDIAMAVKPSEQVVVTNLFTKILKPRRGESGTAATGAASGDDEDDVGGESDPGPLQRSIAYREYAQLTGELGIALEPAGDGAPPLADLLLQISYLGKRGSFLQLVRGPSDTEELPEGFVSLDGRPADFDVNGLVQMVDDCGQSLTFERANVFNAEGIRPGLDRVVRTAVLPYRVTRSSNRYTLYELQL